MNEKIISDISRHGKTARGKQELIKHLSGQRLTQRQAILAKCFDCCGGYADGRQDCRCTRCSLYPFMPFNPDRKNQRMARDQQCSSLPLEATV